MIVRTVEHPSGAISQELSISISDPLYIQRVAEFINTEGHDVFLLARDRSERRARGERTARFVRWVKLPTVGWRSSSGEPSA